MYFLHNRKFNILEVQDDFANLRKIHRNGDIEFDLLYKISPHDAVSNESLTVNVSIFSRTIKLKPILENSHVGFVDSRKLVNNILTNMPSAKSVIQQRAQENITVRSSDVSAKINNEVVGLLRAKVKASSIPQFLKSKLSLKPASSIKATEVKPVLQQIAHNFISNIPTINSASLDERPTRLMHDMIVRQGIDPSHILKLTHRSVPAIDAVGGILRPSRAPEFEHSPSTRLLNYFLFPQRTHNRSSVTTTVDDDTLVQVLTHEIQTHVEVPITLIVPSYALRSNDKNQNNFFVKFELVNGRTGLATDTVIKALDISKHVQLFNTPRIPPIVNASKSDISSKANLEIKQLDPGAESVQIYKKNIHRAVTEISDYELVGTFNVRSDQQSLLVQVDTPYNSTAIYRVVPVGNQQAQGFEYTNIVLNPSNLKQIKSISLVAKPTDLGVQLEIRKIPQQVVAIELKVRNMSIYEKDFRSVGNNLTLIDDAIREADFFSIVDRDVSSGKIYEYVARMIYESGTDVLAGNVTTEFITASPGKVDTKISNVVIDQIDLDVSFEMETTIIDSNLDVVKALLKRQDILSSFEGDVTREREFLKSLIAHNVQRVNMTSGQRDDFGVITTKSFSDRDLRKNQAIQPLKMGNSYRYEIAVLLRSPETMFDALSKDKVDQVTKKSYFFNPAKFLHPVTLSRGVIVTPPGLRTRYAKEPMSHGVVGSVEIIEAAFDAEPAQILDPVAVRFNKFLNVITWKVLGEIDQIDHFIIMKDVDGVRNMVGKAHSEFLFGNCQYLHEVSRRDEGAFSYVIVPVFNDYKAGTEVLTNVIIVEQISSEVSR